MFIDYFTYLLAESKVVLEKEGVPSSVYGGILEQYSSGISLVEPTPEKDHPARLRIGSSLAIHLSKDLHKAGFEVSPEKLVHEIVTMGKSYKEPDFHVDAGNEIFLNAHPSSVFFKKFIQKTLQRKSGGFFLAAYVEQDPEYLKKITANIRDMIAKVDRFKPQVGRVILSELSRSDKLALILSLLSDDEFDIDAVTAHVSFSNNPLAVLSLCRTVLGAEHRILPQGSSRNPYSKPVYFTMLHELVSDAEELIARFRFLELQGALRKRPEILWKEIYKVLLRFRSLWNDPWGRVALGGLSETSDRDNILYLVDMMKWIIQSWDSYMNVLEQLPFEEITRE